MNPRCRASGLSSFVINLRDRKERLASFLTRAASAGFCKVERFEAVDTRSLDLVEQRKHLIQSSAYHRLTEETIVKGYRQEHSDLTPGAVGCALSHMAVANMALQRKLPLVVVFEDDADLRPDTQDLIHGFLDHYYYNNNDIDWDCLLLGWSGAPPAASQARGSSTRTSSSKHTSTMDPTQVQPVKKFWGMHAYLLTVSGMSKLVQLNTPIATQVDHALSHAARKGDFVVYGVSQQEKRIMQASRGSDIQLPLRSLKSV